MKRGWRIFLIILVLLIVVGIKVLTVISLVQPNELGARLAMLGADAGFSVILALMVWYDIRILTKS